MVPCMIMDSSSQSDNEFFSLCKWVWNLSREGKQKKKRPLLVKACHRNRMCSINFSLMCLKHVFGLWGWGRGGTWDWELTTCYEFNLNHTEKSQVSMSVQSIMWLTSHFLTYFQKRGRVMGNPGGGGGGGSWVINFINSVNSIHLGA